MKYRADIDGLRGLAVIPVVLFHADLGWLGGGYVGVDIFFVISGFLITSIIATEIREQRFSIIRFYERRVRRLFPALFAVLIVTSVIAPLILTPDYYVSFAQSQIATTLFISNFLFWRQSGYFDDVADTKPLLHTWTLSVEEQFYIVFPLVLLFALRWLKGRWTPLMVLLALASFLASVFGIQSHPVAIFYLAPARAWELLLGALVALGAVPPPNGQGQRDMLSVIGLGLIVWSLVLYSAETVFPGPAALIPCLGAALIIHAGLSGPSIIGRLLSVRPMVFAGLISYSLYLWHWPVIVFFETLFPDPLTSNRLMVLFGTIFLLSWASWRFVEVPFRYKGLIGRRGLFLGSAVLSVFLIGSAIVVIAAKGFPQRVPAQMVALLDRDQYMHDRMDCHLVTPARVARGDICQRGLAEAPPSFVLAGDSHANAISPAVFLAAERLGLRGFQYTNSGFRPLPGVHEQGNPAFNRDVESFLQFLEGHEEIRTVILTSYWLHVASGSSYRDKGSIWYDKDYDDSGTRYNRIALSRGLEALLARFPERRFVFLDDGPSGRELDIRRNILAAFAGRAEAWDPRVGVPLEVYEGQRAVYEPILSELARRYPNAFYRPIFRALCGAEQCLLFEGRNILYRDGDHLSHFGALKMTDILQALLHSLFLSNSASHADQGFAEP